MKRILIGVAAVMLVALMSGPVFANTQPNAVLALHIQPHAQKGDVCLLDPATVGTPCTDYVTAGDLNTSYDLYLMVAKGEVGVGIGGLSCGIIYNNGELGVATKSDGSGVDMYAWTFCASGLEFPNGISTPATTDDWPASGGGNRMTWDSSVDCQRDVVGSDGVQAVAGVFYIYAYSADFFQVYQNANLQSGPEYQVVDCTSATTDLPEQALTFARFSSGASEQGCNPCVSPCSPVPVRSATWGKIKQKY